MKRLLSLLLCGILLTALFVGCKPKEEKVTPSTEANNTATTETKEEEKAPAVEEEKAVEISMFISMPEYADAIGQLIAEYKKVKPNVTINYETTQNDYPTLLKTKLNSGECPDIFSSTSGKEIGVYLDYSADLAAEPLAAAMAQPVKAVMMSGDELHGLSVKGNFFGLIYNKDIFAEVGITEFPQTFPELEAACETLVAAGYTPFTSGFAEWWTYKHVFQHYLYAAQPEDVEGLVKAFIGGTAHIKDYPELYNDFFNYIDLVAKYGDAKPLETDLSAEIAAFGSGKAAMVSGQGAWIEADVLKIDPELKIGFDGYPVNADPAVTKIIGGSDQALRIYKDSPVLDEVKAFCNWWYTSEYGKGWFANIAGVIPPITEGVLPNFEIIKQGNAHIAAEGAGTLGVSYSTDSFHQAFGEIMQAYVGGASDKDAVCKEIETKWVELEGNN